MKYLRFFLIGIVFGFILSRSEVVSWFRIQEMFRLDSFHMYGFIISAIITAMISLQIIKFFNIKTIEGEKFETIPIEFTPGNVIGGILFGLGWAMIGACPGPMFALLGGGFWMILYGIFGAFIGTLVYGMISTKLP